MKNLRSIMTSTDAYKVSQYLFNPPNTDIEYDYIESRGGKYPATIFCGTQHFVKKYLLTPITKEQIDFAETFWNIRGQNFDRTLWEYILVKYNGFIPLTIHAAPEGSLIPTHNVLVTIQNKDKFVLPLVSWIETTLLRAIWYPTTVATQGYYIKQILQKYKDITSTDDDLSLEFLLHDFSGRGVSSNESAGIGGFAHLINYNGTDNQEGALDAMEYYDGEVNIGQSVKAIQHSNVVSWGREYEKEAYEHHIKRCKPGEIISLVSDSYDVYYACSHIYGMQLKKLIIDSGVKVVIRLDSGDPKTVVLRCLDILSGKFGYTTNKKGYKVINHVKIMQGDGINEDSIEEILSAMRFSGYAIDNIIFGMGGQNTQKVDRDTQKFAMKCSATRKFGEWESHIKDPITDSGKRSKKGRVILCKNENGEYYSDIIENEKNNNQLLLIYENGKLFNEIKMSQVRKNTNTYQGV